MSESDMIDKLAEAVAKHIRPTIPLNIALWDIETVADYFKRVVALQCDNGLLAYPTFPLRSGCQARQERRRTHFTKQLKGWCLLTNIGKKMIGTKHNSTCLANAADDEPIFVLRAQDKFAAVVVRMWAELADAMDDWHTQKSPE